MEIEKRVAEKAVDADERVAVLSRENARLLGLVEAGPSNLEHDAKFLAMRTENAKLKSRNKALAEALANAEKRADFLEAIGDTPTMRQWERLQRKPSKGTTAIIGLMDWHVEERVDSGTINGLNHFDLSVAEARVKRTFEKAVYLLEFARGVAKIDELVLAVLGDTITGYIHEELIESNYLSPTEACLFVSDMLASGIDYLLKHADIKAILIPCCHGNHGRTTPHRLVSTSYKNSFEWGMYHQLAKLYRNERRVTFKIEDGIHNWVEVQGHRVRMHHGDNIRYQGGVGGISIPVNKAIAQWNKEATGPAAFDIFGHYHQFWEHWNWVSCGCLIGYNSYAKSIKADYQPPTQTFITVTKEHGKAMALPVFCDQSKTEKLHAG